MLAVPLAHLCSQALLLATMSFASRFPVKTGQTIGSWVLGKQLGVGEFGAVFECSRAKPAPGEEDQWAIKVVNLKPVNKADEAGKTGKSTSAVLLAREYNLYKNNLLPSIPCLLATSASRYHFAQLPPTDSFNDAEPFRYLVFHPLPRPLLLLLLPLPRAGRATRSPVRQPPLRPLQAPHLRPHHPHPRPHLHPLPLPLATLCPGPPSVRWQCSCWRHWST